MTQSALPLLAVLATAATAQPFLLPTANRALFEPDGNERYFVGTPGNTWLSGAFGCLRSQGWQVHEGLDIRCLERDKRGEPVDPILATAPGRVAYINRKAGLSNYGIYIVLRHEIEGLEVFSLYAHLSRVTEGLEPGVEVAAGQEIGIMGRTANTRTRISRERAHLHFELNLMLNKRFASWYKRRNPGQRNDHGLWNGQNLVAVDPRQVLLTQHNNDYRPSLLHVLRGQPELMRVLVRETDFDWLRRHGPLVRPNPTATQEGVAGYELAFNFNGVAYELIPRAESEIASNARVQLLSVNEVEYELRPCRKLVSRAGTNWRLAPAGERLIDLLLD